MHTRRDDVDPPGRAALRQVTRRLIPFLFVLYVANYLDRVNVSFAALQMNRDLGLSASAYGLGAGMFFLGYCLFQVPSNLLLVRVGARRWIAGLMVAWGAIASTTMAIRSAGEFYALRFALGVVEAGFFPGVILYLTHWFPAAERARAAARFMTAIPISGVLGGPVSGALLALDGRGGLAGWQWLFLLEGLPSVLLGLAVFRYLPDRPAEARWLPPEERAWLVTRLAAEQAAAARPATVALGRALASPLVWRLGALYFLIVAGLYGQGLWLPQLIKGRAALSDLGVGFLAAVPALAAAAAMVVVAAHSDRTGERPLHVAGALAAGAAGFALAAPAAGAPVLATLALSLAAAGFTSALGPFWSLPPMFLRGTAAAAGIALINALGNAAGFVSPYLVGLVKDATGSFAGALLAFALFMAEGAALAAGVRREPLLAPSRS